MKFTYPFRYVPRPEVKQAAQELITRIDAGEFRPPRYPIDLKAALSEGKMLGVLLTDKGPMYAFSGLVHSPLFRPAGLRSDPP